MRLVAFLAGPLAMAALVLAFGWPVLFACFVLALGTFLFSTSDTEDGEPSTTLGAESSQAGRRGHATSFAGTGHAALQGVGSVEPMDADL